MKKIILFSLLVSLAFFSCRKVTEVTEVREGPNNAVGVVYSVMPSDWEAVGDTMLRFSADVPELDGNINDHGAVLVYASFEDDSEGDPVYEALPEVIDFLSFNVFHYIGGVDVEIRDLENLEIGPPPDEVFIKIVLITTEALNKHPNVDLSDYSEMKRVFNVD